MVVFLLLCGTGNFYAAEQKELKNPQYARAGEYLDTIFANGEKNYQVRIGAVDQAVFSLEWWQGDLSFTLTNPEGMIINPTEAAGSADIDYLEENMEFEDGTIGFETRSYIVDNPRSGTWVLNVKGGAGLPEEGMKFRTIVAFDSSLSLTTTVEDEWARLGSSIPIDAQLFDGSKPITTADITATIIKPDDTRDTLILYDDGRHRDGAAKDGNYGNLYKKLNRPGAYAIVIKALTSNTERTVLADFVVPPAVARLQKVISDKGIDTDGNGLYDYLRVGVNVRIDKAGDYILSAELKSKGGNLICRATDLSPGLGTGSKLLHIRFKGKEIGASGIDGPYIVDAVRIFKEGPPLIDYIEISYTTAPYKASQFDGFKGGAARD